MTTDAALTTLWTARNKSSRCATYMIKREKRCTEREHSLRCYEQQTNKGFNCEPHQDLRRVLRKVECRSLAFNQSWPGSCLLAAATRSHSYKHLTYNTVLGSRAYKQVCIRPKLRGTQAAFFSRRSFPSSSTAWAALGYIFASIKVSPRLLQLLISAFYCSSSI